MDRQQQLEELLTRYMEESITTAERAELRSLLQELPPEEISPVMLRSLFDYQLADSYDFAATDASIKAYVTNHIRQEQSAPRAPGLYRLLVRRWRVAASILLLAGATGAGAYYWSSINKVHLQNNDPVQAAAPKDIRPGKKGAILILDNGAHLLLDSIGDGRVTVQKGATLIKKGGELAYTTGSSDPGPVAYNTITTPKGRQFNVRLPDGTLVWLNSGSSIRYPTAFTGNERLVQLSGEAYFEVAGNKQLPFRVKIGEQTEVDVLGTHFNINAYLNEPSINTTLTEGSVLLKNNRDHVLLRPGQQAQIPPSQKIIVKKEADIEKALAWKNGLFNFRYAHLEEVMRQLERWYDIEVVYEKGIPDLTFYGTMSMDLSLAETLSNLEKTGVHFRWQQERKLIVMP
jgi:transmembrane sensor